MGPRKARPWCANGRTERWRFTIAGSDWPLPSGRSQYEKLLGPLRLPPGRWWCGKLSKTIRGDRAIKTCDPGFRTGQWQRHLALEYPLPLRPKLQGFASVGIPTRNIQHKKGTLLISLDKRTAFRCRATLIMSPCGDIR